MIIRVCFFSKICFLNPVPYMVKDEASGTFLHPSATGIVGVNFSVGTFSDTGSIRKISLLPRINYINIS